MLDMQGIRIREGMRVTSADTFGYGIVTDIGANARVRILWTHEGYSEGFGKVEWRDADSVCAIADRYGIPIPVTA